MAATVFDALVSRAGLSGRFAIDSAALRPHHLGRPADPRAIAATDRRGYAWLDSRARQVGPDDFARSLVVGMGEWHVAQLRRLAPDAELRSLARYVATRDVPEVPDPYHGDAREFEHALDLVEEGCAGLLRALGVRRPAVELTTGSAA
jgi:protein-tyrosine phosphatase